MKQLKINKHYSLLKNWWESIELTNFEKSFFNREIISFNQQLFRLKEKKIRIGAYGKSGVGKSSILNSLLKKDIFKTNIINGTTREIKSKDWTIKDQKLQGIELLDSPGFDFCNIEFPDKIYNGINNSDIILFVVAGDINRNEVSEISSFIKDGKKIFIILNKIDLFKKNELKEIIENIKFNPELISDREDADLIDKLNQYKDIFGKSLLNLEPHLLANYLYDLASEFHSYYSNVRIITEDINYSRVYLINSVQKILKNGLGLLNVSAPTKM